MGKRKKKKEKKKWSGEESKSGLASFMELYLTSLRLGDSRPVILSLLSLALFLFVINLLFGFPFFFVVFSLFSSPCILWVCSLFSQHRVAFRIYIILTYQKKKELCCFNSTTSVRLLLHYQKFSLFIVIQKNLSVVMSQQKLNVCAKKYQ